MENTKKPQHKSTTESRPDEWPCVRRFMAMLDRHDAMYAELEERKVNHVS
jgi:hypothetical protein